LRGVYQLQFRVQQREHFLQSPHWLFRVLPPGTLSRPAFRTPLGVIRDYVSHFISTIRNGYQGRWRLLEAAVGPYG
jgi:hypothetical protein